MKVDVVVVGSGGAGLAAALSAACGMARVAVVERAIVFGGTTTFSGGTTWVPNNKHMAEKGIADSRDEGLAYIRRLTLGTVADSLIERYVDASNELVDFLESQTELRYNPNLEHADYQERLPGAKLGGRSLQVGLFDTHRLGKYKDSIRHGYATGVALTRQESDQWKRDRSEHWVTLGRERSAAGLVGNGRALIGFLLEGCLSHGVEFVIGARAVKLTRDGRRITGVIVERDGQTEHLEAEQGVILGCGGFEWNPTMVQRFLGVPMIAPGSPPVNEGDGLRMSMEVGASLGNMTEAWWNLMYAIPGDAYEGRPLYRVTSDVRGLPGAILVNRGGRRFVNEAMNYNDLGKALRMFDPFRFEYSNLPAFLVFDAELRATQSFGPITPQSADPEWLVKADTLDELAGRLGVDVSGLRDQIARFNADAARGEDPEFHRGAGVYDRYHGDVRATAHPNLRPLDKGPYYGTPLYLGCIGTKGGPLTNEDGQVVDTHEEPIPGLYACGNTAASPFGPGYPGAGATLGAAMTMGFLAGRAIVKG